MSYKNVYILKRLSRLLFIMNDAHISNKKLIDSW